MSEENTNDFRDLMRTFRQKKIRLLEEIETSKKYIKHINKKLDVLAEEEDAAIAGIKNFDDDQLLIFDLGNVKNEFEQGGELDNDTDEDDGEELGDENMDDDQDLDIEDPEDEESDDDSPIEFADEDEEESEDQETEEQEAETAIR